MLDYIRRFFPLKQSTADKIIYQRSYLGERDLIKLQKIIFDLAKSLHVPKRALDNTKVSINFQNKMSVITDFNTKYNLKKNKFFIKPKQHTIKLNELDAIQLLDPKPKGSKPVEFLLYEAFKRKDIKAIQRIKGPLTPKEALKTISLYRLLSRKADTADQVKACLAHEFGHIVKYWQDLGKKNYKLSYFKMTLLSYFNILLFDRLKMKYKREHENFADDFVNQNPTLKRALYEYFQKIVDMQDAFRSFYYATITTKPYIVREYYKLRYYLNEKIHSFYLSLMDPHRSYKQRAILANS